MSDEIRGFKISPPTKAEAAFQIRLEYIDADKPAVEFSMNPKLAMGLLEFLEEYREKYHSHIPPSPPPKRGRPVLTIVKDDP